MNPANVILMEPSAMCVILSMENVLVEKESRVTPVASARIDMLLSMEFVHVCMFDTDSGGRPTIIFVMQKVLNSSCRI